MLSLLGNKERGLFAHFFHYYWCSDSVLETGQCLDSCLPGITLCQQCSVAAGLLQYKCTMTAAHWMVEVDWVDGSGTGGGVGWCLLCNMVWSGDQHPSLKLCSHYFWNLYISYVLFDSVCPDPFLLIFSHCNKPKSTKTSLKFSVILSWSCFHKSLIWHSFLTPSPPFPESWS